MRPYHGYSYSYLLSNRLVRFIWKKLCCPTGHHLWDEVSDLWDHYLYCDACGKMIAIDDQRTASINGGVLGWECGSPDCQHCDEDDQETEKVF